MSVQFAPPPAPPLRRSSATDLSIVAGAAGLALVSALAAQMGVPRAQPLVGAIVILGIAYAFSADRRAIDTRTVAWGLSLQIVFALIVLKTTAGQLVFETLGRGINRLLGFAGVGAAFVFGPLGDNGVWARVMNAALGPEGARYGVVFFGVITYFTPWRRWLLTWIRKRQARQAMRELDEQDGDEI